MYLSATIVVILVPFFTCSCSYLPHSIRHSLSSTAMSIGIVTCFGCFTHSAYADSGDDYRVNLNRDYIVEVKSSLDDISQRITPDTNTNNLYDEIKSLTDSLRTKDRLRFISEYSNSGNSGTSCLKSNGEQAIYDLNTIFEYFSISNDGMKKVMISDAFPGQKLKFIQQGLVAVRSDLQQFLFCPR